MAVGEPCTLINRTSQPLSVLKNGRILVLKPGKNTVTTDWVRFAKNQHPRMGTGDQSGNIEFLVGVEGFDPPEACSMIAPGEEHKNGGIERFDRTLPDFDALGATAVPVATGIQPPTKRSTAGGMSPLPDDTLVSARD